MMKREDLVTNLDRLYQDIRHNKDKFSTIQNWCLTVWLTALAAGTSPQLHLSDRQRLALPLLTVTLFWLLGAFQFMFAELDGERAMRIELLLRVRVIGVAVDSRRRRSSSTLGHEPAEERPVRQLLHTAQQRPSSSILADFCHQRSACPAVEVKGACSTASRQAVPGRRTEFGNVLPQVKRENRRDVIALDTADRAHVAQALLHHSRIPHDDSQTDTYLSAGRLALQGSMKRFDASRGRPSIDRAAACSPRQTGRALYRLATLTFPLPAPVAQLDRAPAF
jgi:hypothetical protein